MKKLIALHLLVVWLTTLLLTPSCQTIKNAKTANLSPDKEKILRLIDELGQIDKPTVGLHPTVSTNGFVAEDQEMEFAGGILGESAPTVYPAFKSLVQFGVAALPELIAHLSDTQPTKLWISRNKSITGYQVFRAEYESKNLSANAPPSSEERSLDRDYAVKVGDVCFVAIGQIVNRRLIAVRYQPSGNLVINSPLEEPSLVSLVKNDWGSATAEDLEKSLIADLESSVNDPWLKKGAVKRLRFYFPDAYQKLKLGKLKATISKYE